MITVTQNLLSEKSLIGELATPALVTVSESIVSAASASTPAVFYDSNLNVNESATTWKEYQLAPVLGIEPVIEVGYGPLILNNNRVSPDGNGGIGSVRIQNGIVGQVINLQSQKIGASTYKEFDFYTPGSISAYLADQVTAILDETPDLAYFSTVNHSTSTYTRNVSCWAASIDLSAVAVATSHGSGWIRQRAGTLITPRHVLFARHYTPPVGAQIRFAGSDGIAVETKTILAVQSGFGDCAVGLLDSAVTVATPMKVTGSWIAQDQVVSQSSTQVRSYYLGGAAIYIDQFANVYACGLANPTSKQSIVAPDVTFNGTLYAACDSWATASHTTDILGGFAGSVKRPVSGDSGSPVMAIIEGEPVLLWCWWTSSSGPPTWRHNGGLLNALIAAVDASASVTTSLTVTVATDPTL
jgi:hypothetical protein